QPLRAVTKAENAAPSTALKLPHHSIRAREVFVSRMIARYDNSLVLSLFVCFNHSMMKNTRSLAVLLALCAANISAAVGDNRFDGTWVGTETAMYQDGLDGMLKSAPYAQSRPAKIVIAQGGTLLGVLEGYGPGRYNDVRRVGNTIVFHAGKRTGQLTLSADGKTMTEKGQVLDTIKSVGGREGA